MKPFKHSGARASVRADSVYVTVSSDATHAWARRSGNAWPCSGLEGRRISAAFFSDGLCDLAIDGREDIDVDVHEFNALTSDVLAAKLPREHPCWFVCVGQFISASDADALPRVRVREV